MKISVDLSSKGILDLKKALVHYRDVELPNKCKRLVDALSEQGISIVSQNVGGFGKYIVFSSRAEPRKDGCMAVVMAVEIGKIISSWLAGDGIKTAEVSPLLMAEFGSGWGAENPMKIEGVGQGTFPNQTHAFDKEGWYWQDLDGIWHHSKGIKAKMPMYKASVYIREAVSRTAKEVFGCG